MTYFSLRRCVPIATSRYGSLDWETPSGVTKKIPVIPIINNFQKLIGPQKFAW